jgi:sigma-B regulation protein RsbU (phosphoserine phosphatase)
MDLVGNHGRVSIGRRHADEPGGDFAIVLPSSNGQLFCFLGDVTGHGRRAARLAREMEGLVRDLAPRLAPGALIGEINSRIEATWAPNIFASAVCLSLDPAHGCGVVAVAGQLPPVLRSGTTTRALPVSSGPPVGVISGHAYADTPFELADGDAMVLVTDGVTDPLATDLDALGLGALLEVVNDGPRDLAELCTGLLRATEAHGSHDDATVIALARSTWALGHPLCSIAP